MGRFLLAASIVSTIAVVCGCTKKEVPALVDAEPTPAVTTAPTITELAPLTPEDAGDDSGPAEAGPKRVAGPAVPQSQQNQQRLQACCNALRAQAKTLGSSPEGFQLNGAAAQCDVFVKQVGAAGNAPELAALRSLLSTVKLPAACQ
jgi:hypothetical protein